MKLRNFLRSAGSVLRKTCRCGGSTSCQATCPGYGAGAGGGVLCGDEEGVFASRCSPGDGFPEESVGGVGQDSLRDGDQLLGAGGADGRGGESARRGHGQRAQPGVPHRPLPPRRGQERQPHGVRLRSRHQAQVAAIRGQIFSQKP